MEELYFDKEYLFRGEWWLPQENSSPYAAGTLALGPQDIQLELWGKGAKHFFSYSSNEDGPIFGYSDRGEKITIVDGYAKSSGDTTHTARPDERFPHAHIVSNLVIVGEHLRNYEEPQFKKAYAKYRNLELWLDTRIFSRESGKDTPRGYEGKIKFTIPKSLFNLNYQDQGISLKTHHSLSYTTDFYTSPGIRHTPYIVFESEKNISANEFSKIANSFERLLSMFNGGYSPLLNISLEAEESESAMVQLYARFYRDYEKQLSIHDIVFRFPEIKSELEKIVTAWFRLDEIFRIATIQFHRQLPKEIYDVTKFLNFLQCVEVLAKKSSREKFDSILKNLVQNLLGENSREFWILEEENLRKLIDTRNHYTHLDSRSSEKIFNERELMQATDQLMLLTYVILFNKIGISSARAIDKLKSHQDFGWKMRKEITS